MTSFTGSTESSAASSVLYFQTPAAVVSAPTTTTASQPTTTAPNNSGTASPVSSSIPSSSKQILGKSLVIRNVSGQAMTATVTGNDGTTRTFNIPAMNSALMCQLNAPVQQSATPLGITYYSGVTAAMGVGVGGGDVSFTVSGDGSGQLTLTIGEAGVLRGSVYTTTTGQFGACWSPGANVGASFAEGYICLGTDGITLGADASPGGVVTGFSIQFKPVAPSNTPQTANTAPQPVSYAALTLNALPDNGGTVGGGGDFALGSSRTVTAMPNRGFIFERWTENGIVVSSSANYNFTFNGSRSLIAHFRPDFMNRPFAPSPPPNNQIQNPWSAKNPTPNSSHRTNQFFH